MSTDRIEKSIVMRAPRSRVWRALTSSQEFGEWFGARLDGAFAPGAKVAGRITTKGYDHLQMEIVIERVEPEHLFSYRWHPYAVDPDLDYSSEPMTLVEFQLHDVPEGTRLSVVESGLRPHSGRASGHGVPHERRRLGGADGQHRALSE